MKFACMARQRGTWPTRVMCALLEVSRSGFYEWLGRAPSSRSLERCTAEQQIRQSFELSDRTYGSPRVWHDLRRLAAVRKEPGCTADARCTAASAHEAPPAARRWHRRMAHNIRSRLTGCEREFEADGPNKKWVADFTYVWTAEGWLYVAAVMDLFSRRIVGWSMSDTMHAKLVTDALADGAVAAGQAEGADASLGPGQSVHERGLPALL